MTRMSIQELGDGRKVLAFVDPETGVAEIVSVMKGEIPKVPTGYAMFNGRGEFMGTIQAQNEMEAVEKFLEGLQEQAPFLAVDAPPPLSILDLLQRAGALPTPLSHDEQILRDIRKMQDPDEDQP